MTIPHSLSYLLPQPSFIIQPCFLCLSIKYCKQSFKWNSDVYPNSWLLSLIIKHANCGIFIWNQDRKNVTGRKARRRQSETERERLDSGMSGWCWPVPVYQYESVINGNTVIWTVYRFFFILAVNCHLSFVHLTVLVISKFWIYGMKRSLYGNYWSRNYHFTVQFYSLKTNSWLLNRLQTVILLFKTKFLTIKQVTNGNFTICIHLLSFNEYEQ